MLIHLKRKLVASMLALLVSGCLESNKKAYKELELENIRLQVQLDSLAMQVDSVYNEQNAAQSSTGQINLLSESDIDYLRTKGLDNPVESIKADLLKNNKLIPVKGSLGGIMQFYKERIHVLNRQWVMAYFEDGHNAGEMLLEYKIDNTGRITWKVLTASVM